MRTVAQIVKVMRPDQWVKNLVLFAGLVFAGGLRDPRQIGLASAGFIIFCGLSGAAYILNDLMDATSDRRHPDKQTRPIASGALSARTAAATAILLAAAALVVSYRIHPHFGNVAASYLALNILYSVALRRMVILDIMSIAIGFVLRAVGSVESLRTVAPQTELSPWLLVCTFFLALFLGLGKRRHEVLVLGPGARDHRSTLAFYSPPLLDALIAVVTASTVVAYAIYTIWPGTVEKVGSAGLVYTVPFVVYGVMRYLYIMFACGGGGKPSRSLMSDLPLIMNIILWVLAVAAVIYIS